MSLAQQGLPLVNPVDPTVGLAMRLFRRGQARSTNVDQTGEKGKPQLSRGKGEIAGSDSDPRLSLDPPFVDWWTLFGFNTGGGPCRAWCVGAGACRGSGWWVVGGLSTAGLSGVRQVLV